MAGSQERPIGERTNAQRNGDSSQDRTPSPGLSVRILEIPEQPEGARERENEADQREIEDLIAQQGMADSTAEIVLWTRLQFLLALAGTAALIYTLSLSRKSTKAAIDAVKMERAWVMLGPIQSGRFLNGFSDGKPVQNGIAIIIVLSNAGRSPATKVHTFKDWKVVGISDPAPYFESDFSGDGIDAVIPPSGIITVSLVLDDEESAKIRSRQSKVVVYVSVKYFDIFGNKETGTPNSTEICFSAIHQGGIVTVNGETFESFDFAPVGRQNTAT